MTQRIKVSSQGNQMAWAKSSRKIQKKTAPENEPSQKIQIHLPTIHFQGRTVGFKEGILTDPSGTPHHHLIFSDFNKHWCHLPVNGFSASCGLKTFQELTSYYTHLLGKKTHLQPIHSPIVWQSSMEMCTFSKPTTCRFNRLIGRPCLAAFKFSYHHGFWWGFWVGCESQNFETSWNINKYHLSEMSSSFLNSRKYKKALAPK